MGDFFRRLWIRSVDERGASLVEYALLIALIVMVAFIAIVALGNNASVSLDDSGSRIVNAR